MTHVAVFQDGTQAEETARVLREQGYDADVATQGSESYGDAAARFFLGGDTDFHAEAMVMSLNADATSFDNAVTRHYGRVIKGTTE